jgi:hypothetical protein
MKVTWRGLGKAALDVASAVPLAVSFGLGLFIASTAPTDIRLELALVMISCVSVFVFAQRLRLGKR